MFGGFPWKTKGGGLSLLRKIRRSNGFGFRSFWVNPFTWPSLKEIGEMACVASARSYRGHALNSFRTPLFEVLLFLGPGNFAFSSPTCRPVARAPYRVGPKWQKLIPISDQTAEIKWFEEPRQAQPTEQTFCGPHWINSTVLRRLSLRVGVPFLTRVRC